MKRLERIATARIALRQHLDVPVIWKTITMWHIDQTCFTEDLYATVLPVSAADNAWSALPALRF